VSFGARTQRHFRRKMLEIDVSQVKKCEIQKEELMLSLALEPKKLGFAVELC
jgi:hypothetical protein